MTDNETYKWDDQLGKWKPATGVVDNTTLALTSSYFKSNTYVTRDTTTGAVLLIFEWDATGSQLSEQITTRLYNAGNQPLGIFEGAGRSLAAQLLPVTALIGAIVGWFASRWWSPRSRL